MKTALLEKIREAAAEWARAHNIETTLIEAKYSGVGSSVHVFVVARRGFENWWWSERDRSLFRFLHAKVNGADEFIISSLNTMTEEEYEKYEGVEV